MWHRRCLYYSVVKISGRKANEMPNGDFSLVQRTVHEMVYGGICQLCCQPVNVPFTYKGKTFTNVNDTKASRAHVMSQRDNGKWSNGNILEAHQYCNNLMVAVSDIEWVISTFFAEYTSVENVQNALSAADTLYSKVQDAMSGKSAPDAETLTVLKKVAHRILTDPESNIVTRIYPKRRETILRLAS
jgi:hypothetical protein